MTRTARTIRTARPVALTLLGMAAWFVAPLAAAPAHAAEHGSGHAAAQQAYVASLLASHDGAAGYTQMDDYVRGLVYWRHHRDWGISVGGVA